MKHIQIKHVTIDCNATGCCTMLMCHLIDLVIKCNSLRDVLSVMNRRCFGVCVIAH